MKPGCSTNREPGLLGVKVLSSLLVIHGPRTDDNINGSTEPRLGRTDREFEKM
jgi:hypothetical protein